MRKHRRNKHGTGAECACDFCRNEYIENGEIRRQKQNKHGTGAEYECDFCKNE